VRRKKVAREILTINRYCKPDGSFCLLEKLRLFTKEAKKIHPRLNKYKLYDVGLVPKLDYILIKLYFYK
jgi:hypothetical protein